MNKPVYMCSNVSLDHGAWELVIHMMSVLLKTGRGIGTETRGLDNVFPLQVDDLIFFQTKRK